MSRRSNFEDWALVPYRVVDIDTFEDYELEIVKNNGRWRWGCIVGPQSGDDSEWPPDPIPALEDVVEYHRDSKQGDAHGPLTNRDLPERCECCGQRVG